MRVFFYFLLYKNVYFNKNVLKKNKVFVIIFSYIGGNMEEEISLKDLINILFLKKRIIFIVTIICLILGVVYYAVEYEESKDGKTQTTSIVDTTYLANNLFTLGSREKIVTSTDLSSSYTVSDSTISVNSSTASLFSQILKSQDTFNTIIDEFNLNLDYEKWEQVVEVSQPYENISILSISFEYSDSEAAINVVNRLTQILENKIREIYSTYNIPTPIIMIQDAEFSEIEDVITAGGAPQEVNNSNTLIKAVAIPVAGFVIVCIIIIFIECINDSVKSKEQIEKSLKAKNLAVISKDEKETDEQLKMLRINISECKKILVTSAYDTENRNWLAVNLAKSFAKLNKKVLLIDLNNQNINLIKNYNRKGLSDYLESGDRLIEKYANETSINNLSILTLGNDIENATELLEGKKMQETMDTLERLFDVILISSNGVLESANTLAISKVSKYTILVIKARKDKLDDCARAKKNIEDLGGTVIGTVLSL